MAFGRFSQEVRTAWNRIRGRERWFGMSGSTLAQLEPATDQAERQRTILVVDDDPSQVEVLTIRLKAQGFSTLAANTGKQALSLAIEKRPSLIVLDLQLPDLDGLEICGQLSDDPATCTIPVIILSGMERPDILRRSRAAGCQYYVRKPYDPNALLLLIENALNEPPPW